MDLKKKKRLMQHWLSKERISNELMIFCLKMQQFHNRIQIHVIHNLFMCGLLQKSIQKRSIQKSYYYPTNSSYTGCLEPEIIAIDAEVGRWAARIVDRMRTAGNEISGMISSMNSPWGGLGKAWVRRSTGMTRSCRIVVVLGRWRGSRTFLHTPVGAQTRDWN